MEVTTKSDNIQKARKINLELILSEHCRDCTNCIWNYNCQLKDLADEFGAEFNRFPPRKSHYPEYRFGPSIYFDSKKCIDCRNCVDACNNQCVGYLEIKEKGHLFQVKPSEKKNKDCIYCGQCVAHCPVGALQAVGEFDEVEKPLADRDKIVIFQFAPSVRSSIGEEFGLPYGSIATGQIVAAIKKLGADRVFDTAVGADFTTFEEANELIERLIKNKKLPMFTSCCPAWVKYVEFYHPKLIPNLTTVRSPQIIFGGVIKTFWAKREKIDPKRVVVISIMPCTSKKFEITRDELRISGLKPVDYVLTTRELAYLFIRHNIDLKNIAPQPCDSPLGQPSGAGLIYGVSGGVMESALRTAYEKITGEDLPRLEFENVRGLEGIKIAEVDIKGKKVKVAVVNEIRNAEKVILELKTDRHKYDYIEVMACRGGCIGGGGQPVPVNDEIRQKRAGALYDADSESKLRKAHKNPELLTVYEECLTSKKMIQKISYTRFRKKKKGKGAVELK
jgi:NADH-quinone oxidoreductase subunit G/NADP-reducing hydrogenase subunit HndD